MFVEAVGLEELSCRPGDVGGDRGDEEVGAAKTRWVGISDTVSGNHIDLNTGLVSSLYNPMLPSPACTPATRLS